MRKGLGVGVLMVGALLSGFLLSSDTSALTYGSNIDIQFNFLPTLSVTFSPNTGFIIDNLSAGNAAASNTVTVTVSSNTPDGYVLSATVGKTDDNNRNNNRLVHTNNTNYFEGIATNANSTLSNLGANKWGYSTYDSTNEVWSNYNGLATVGNIGTTILTSDTSATKTIDMKIGASAAASQVSGTFTNDINFTATANVVTYNYNLTYNANNSSTVTNMPTDITNSSFNTGDSIQLSSTTPTADSRIFLGWCDGTVSDTTCTGTLYQPGDYLKLDNLSSSITNVITLTGVWRKLYMQTMSASDCTTTPTGAYDSRGTEQAYKVARLADGKCWMLENLNLAGGTALTSADTDVTDTYINGFTTQANLTKSGNSIVLPVSATKNTDDNNLTDSSQFQASAAAYVFNSGNTTNCGASGQDTPCYSYYSWIAATLGGKDSTGTQVVRDYETDAAASICPKGWRLPTSRELAADNSDFYQLVINYGVSSDLTSQSTSIFYDQAGPGTLPNFLLAGYYYRGSFVDGGSYGWYWSATAYDSTYSFLLGFDSGEVVSANSGRRNNGFSVRCVLNE